MYWLLRCYSFDIYRSFNMLETCSCMGGRGTSFFPGLFFSLKSFHKCFYLHKFQLKQLILFALHALIDMFCFFICAVLCFQLVHRTHQLQLDYTISRIQAQHQNHKCGQRPVQITKILIAQKVVHYPTFNVWQTLIIRQMDVLLISITALKWWVSFFFAR